jgi:hypothetical protein
MTCVHARARVCTRASWVRVCARARAFTRARATCPRAFTRACARALWVRVHVHVCACARVRSCMQNRVGEFNVLLLAL